ncbi:MAG: phage head-tail connector protein [Holosporaceae bacterium]|jgi:uncharacterized phiE125 gp8 family phage protein|nr:phage head-tail connector protein [Holosporaceae bacterium]
MSLYLLKPPGEEMISLPEGKTYLRVEHNFDDDCLLGLIRSTREALETVIQKSILKQTWKYVINGDFFLRKNQLSFCANSTTIPLPRSPLIKIIDVTLDGQKLDGKKYSFEKFSSAIRLHMSIDCKKNGPLEVVYEAGIAENAQNIPYQLKLANLMLLANAYQERYSGRSEGLFSKGVRQLLSPFINLRLY